MSSDPRQNKQEASDQCLSQTESSGVWSWLIHRLRKIPLRQKLVLIFVFVFGLTLIGFSFFSFHFLSSSLQRQFDEALYNYAVDVNDGITLDLSGDLEFSKPQFDRRKIYPFSFGTPVIFIRNRHGQVFSQDGSAPATLVIPYEREFHRLSSGEDAVYRTVSAGSLENAESDSYRVVSIAIDNSPMPNLILQVAAPTTFLEEQLKNRRLIFFGLIPIILLLTTILNYWLSRRAFQPVMAMIEQAEKLTALNLSQRIQVPVARDELHHLAQALNLMLARLERAFQSQERFVADASHQLLTPLSLLRAELEEMSQKTEFSFAGMFDEIDSLSRLVKHLLILARLEQGQAHPQIPFKKVFFDELLFDVARRLEKKTKAKNIRLILSLDPKFEIEGGPEVLGEEEFLKTLIFNLVENALKYSPSHSTITARLVNDGGGIRFDVQDEGPGVSEKDLEMLFQSFYRSALEPVQKIPGFGLGLALVEKIAKFHGGYATVQNVSPRGALFSFWIKKN